MAVRPVMQQQLQGAAMRVQLGHAGTGAVQGQQAWCQGGDFTMAEQQHDLAGLPGPALQPFAPARQARVIPAIQRGNRKLHQAEPGGGGRHAWQVLWQAAQRLLHAVVGTLEQAQACRPVVVRQQRQHRLGATAQRHQNGVLQCGGGGQHAGAEQVGRRTAGRDDPVQAAPAHLNELRRQSGYGKVGCCHAGEGHFHDAHHIHVSVRS
ncbi:hypothetical protein G6F35_014553 [Rhizopus arrhizus]|nr:hypothetical protein G6F35_014553 [Rhizopus arrhizus]